MKEILNIPEVNAIVGALITALFAFIKRKLDMNKMRKDHAEEIANIVDTHAIQVDTLNGTIVKLKKALDA